MGEVILSAKQIKAEALRLGFSLFSGQVTKNKKTGWEKLFFLLNK